MKPSKLVVSFLSVALLSACSNTMDSFGPKRSQPLFNQIWTGVKSDARELDNWMHSEPSNLDFSIGPAPTGYTNSNRVALMKPDGLMDVEMTAPMDDEASLAPLPESVETAELPEVFDSPTWEEAEAYSKSRQPQFTENEEEPYVPYGTDVQIFPLDGDTSSIPTISDEGIVSFNDDFSARNDDSSLTGGITKQIFFEDGAASLREADRLRLEAMASSIIHSRGEYWVTLVGHASKSSDEDANYKMGLKRAKAVKEALASAGVLPDHITTVSKGDDTPNTNPNGRPQQAADRRVDIYIDNH